MTTHLETPRSARSRSDRTPADRPRPDRDVDLLNLIEDHRELLDVDALNLDALVERIGSSRIVLLGESTHGTKDFYDLRAAITMKLVREKGFNLVSLEADWPDMEGVNNFIHGRAPTWKGFARFPEWMWRNESFSKFSNDLRAHNSSERNLPVSVFGLDVYSLSQSLEHVYRFLSKHNPEAAALAKKAKQCLHPWQFDPSQYGLAVWREHIEGCEKQVFELLGAMHDNAVSASPSNSTSLSSQTLLSALQNARIARNAEEYYRTMYESSVESWNLRDQHMFETMLLLLDHFGPLSKMIVWEHNSHLGNAAVTQMGRVGELNVGQLCRSRFGDQCYSVGFMTNGGRVAAASQWDAPVEIKTLAPARNDSFENLFHRAGGDFFLPLRSAPDSLR